MNKYAVVTVLLLYCSISVAEAIPISSSVIVETKIGADGAISQRVVATYPLGVYELILENARFSGFSTVKDYIISKIPRDLRGKVRYSEVIGGNEAVIAMEVYYLSPEEAERISGGKITISRTDGYIVFEDRSFMNQTHADDAWLHYYLEMPGEIVNCGATIVRDNRAEWHLKGADIGRKIYAVSKTSATPGFELLPALVIISALSVLIRKRKL